MQFAHFPRGEVSSRDLDTRFFCTSERYPEYSVQLASRQAPFTVTLEDGMACMGIPFTSRGESVRFYPPLYQLYRRRWNEKAVRRLTSRRKRVERFDGTVVVLDCTESDYCYGHWMTEVLPCFHVIEQSCLGPHRLYLALGAVRKYKVEQLKHMGYRREDVILQESHRFIRADRLVYVSQTRYSGWARDYVRERFKDMGPPRASGRRLYVSRLETQSRVVINDGEVRKVLERHGFETVDSLYIPFREQVRMFREASCVVMQMGSAVYNFWFAPPRAKLLLLRGDREYRWSEILRGLDVYHLSCDEYSHKRTDGRVSRDLVADIGDLEATITEMVGK